LLSLSEPSGETFERILKIFLNKKFRLQTYGSKYFKKLLKTFNLNLIKN